MSASFPDEYGVSFGSLSQMQVLKNHRHDSSLEGQLLKFQTRGGQETGCRNGSNCCSGSDQVVVAWGNFTSCTKSHAVTKKDNSLAVKIPWSFDKVYDF